MIVVILDALEKYVHDDEYISWNTNKVDTYNNRYCLKKKLSFCRFLLLKTVWKIISHGAISERSLKNQQNKAFSRKPLKTKTGQRAGEEKKNPTKSNNNIQQNPTKTNKFQQKPTTKTPK